MKAHLFVLTPVLTLSTLQLAYAQDASANAPTQLEPTYGKPQIKVLKKENNGPSHYEKWQERTLVILGNVAPSADGKTYTTSELKIPTFNLLIQSSQEEADFSKRWDALKEELSTITTATPELKRWEVSKAPSRSETVVPAQTLRPTAKNGLASYMWVTRIIEMEGVQAEGETMYKAVLRVQTDKPTTRPIKPGQALDTETGKIAASD